MVHAELPDETHPLFAKVMKHMIHRNDSQITTRLIKDRFGIEYVKDIVGGVRMWAEVVDKVFPVY